MTPATPPHAMAGPWPSLAVVVPVYNEESGIRAGVSARSLRWPSRYPGRAAVIAVDDGSTDGSGDASWRGSRTRSELLRGVHAREQRGYGAALRTGAERAGSLGFEYVAFIDSDLTNPPEDLLKIGELAARGHPYIKAFAVRRRGAR